MPAREESEHQVVRVRDPRQPLAAECQRLAETRNVPANPHVFVARFSIERGDLLDKDEVAVVPAGQDPNQPGVVPILTVPLTDLGDLRRGQAAVGPNAAAIKAVVRYFDDFVFHIEIL